VSPRAGLHRCGKSCPTGIRSPDRPARSQSLYRLSYRAESKVVAPKHVAATLKTVRMNYIVVLVLVLRMFLNFAMMCGINSVKKENVSEY
jgi:hypothetical protein